MLQQGVGIQSLWIVVVLVALALACIVWTPFRVTEAFGIMASMVMLVNLRLYEPADYRALDDIEGGAAEMGCKELGAQATEGIITQPAPATSEFHVRSSSPLTGDDTRSSPPGPPPPPTSMSDASNSGVDINAGAAGPGPAEAPPSAPSTTPSPRPARSLLSTTPRGSLFELSPRASRPSNRSSGGDEVREVDTRPRRDTPEPVGPSVQLAFDNPELLRHTMANLPPREHDKPEEPSESDRRVAEDFVRRHAEAEQAPTNSRRSSSSGRPRTDANPPTTVPHSARADPEVSTSRANNAVAELVVGEVEEASPSTAKPLNCDFKGPLIDLIPLSERLSLDNVTSAWLGELHAAAYIGGGAYGTVYGVRGARSGAIRAVKVINKTVLGPKLCADLLPREKKAGESLIHNNIVRADRWLETDTYAFLVMEYVRGTTLADVIAEAGGKGLAPQLVTSIMGQLLAATLFMSANGWLHRDLKPENIVLEHHTGRVVIVDFGVACRVEEVSKWTTEAAGSFPTMAPEVALRLRDYHTHHNIPVNISIASHTTYPLAAIYLELSTGLEPYDCPNPQVGMRHLLQLVKGTRKLPSLDGIPPRTAMMLRGIFENCERPSLDAFIWALPLDMRPATYRPKPVRKARTPTISNVSNARPASSISGIGSHVGSNVGRDRPSRNVSRCINTNTHQPPRWRR